MHNSSRIRPFTLKNIGKLRVFWVQYELTTFFHRAGWQMSVTNQSFLGDTLTILWRRASLPELTLWSPDQNMGDVVQIICGWSWKNVTAPNKGCSSQLQFKQHRIKVTAKKLHVSYVSAFSSSTSWVVPCRAYLFLHQTNSSIDVKSANYVTIMSIFYEKYDVSSHGTTHNENLKQYPCTVVRTYRHVLCTMECNTTDHIWKNKKKKTNARQKSKSDKVYV